jgi:uncharacterized protein YfdQ (DUF2303 family)
VTDPTPYTLSQGEIVEDASPDTRAVIELTQRAVEPTLVEPGHVYTVVVPAGGHLAQVDLTGDQYRDRPRRKTGQVRLDDAPSFTAYYGKHATEDSEVYADLDWRTITAVLDAHGQTEANWAQHRAVFELSRTKSWQVWTLSDGKWMPQEAFAEQLEARAIDVITPPAADMLELAQSFQATTKVNFASGRRLATGERALLYTEETNATAGKRGELTIPASFDLLLQPFDGFEQRSRITARFRYRIVAEGKLLLSYVLDRPDDTLRAAFQQVSEWLGQELSVDVLAGRPG